MRLWDLETGQELFRFEGNEAGINDVAISSDGRRALTGGHDKIVRLWGLPK